MLEGALHGGVERVEALQRERLGGEARGRRVAVVGEHAVREREAARLVEPARGALVEDAQPELDVAEQPPLVGERRSRRRA